MEECSRRLDQSRRSNVHQILFLFLFLAEYRPLSQWSSVGICRWLQKSCKQSERYFGASELIILHGVDRGVVFSLQKCSISGLFTSLVNGYSRLLSIPGWTQTAYVHISKVSKSSSCVKHLRLVRAHWKNKSQLVRSEQSCMGCCYHNMTISLSHHNTVSQLIMSQVHCESKKTCHYTFICNFAKC